MVLPVQVSVWSEDGQSLVHQSVIDVEILGGVGVTQAQRQNIILQGKKKEYPRQPFLGKLQCSFLASRELHSLHTQS